MKSSLCISTLVLVLAASAWSQQPSTSTGKPGQKSDSTSGKSATNPKKKLLDADLQGFELSDDKSANLHTGGGQTRGGGAPLATLLAPKMAKLYGPSALFQWRTTGSNEGYILTIFDEDEARVVREQVKDPSYKLSSGLDKLKPGENYQWRVQVLPQTIPAEGLDFTVVSAEERQQIEKDLAVISAADPYEAGFRRARVFVDHHLWFDAIGAYTELIEKYPNRAELYEDRGSIYSSIEATRKLGEADRAKAANLAH